MQFKQKRKTFRESAEGQTAFEPDGAGHDLDGLFGEDFAATSAPDRRKIEEANPCPCAVCQRGGRCRAAGNS